MRRPLLLGLALVVAGTGGVFAAELVLPEHPGTDQFDTSKAIWEIQDTFGQMHVIECGGPEMWGRGMPEPTTGMVPVEIMALNLQCSGGVTVHLDPNRPSMGQISKSGDRFFDVFFEIDGFPPGGGRQQVTNLQPVTLQAKIAHVPPYGALYFNRAPVQLVD